MHIHFAFACAECSICGANTLTQIHIQTQTHQKQLQRRDSLRALWMPDAMCNDDRNLKYCEYVNVFVHSHIRLVCSTVHMFMGPPRAVLWSRRVIWSWLSARYVVCVLFVCLVALQFRIAVAHCELCTSPLYLHGEHLYGYGRARARCAVWYAFFERLAGRGEFRKNHLENIILRTFATDAPENARDFMNLCTFTLCAYIEQLSLLPLCRCMRFLI